MNASLYDYTERPKRFKREDFWSQVRRTINGKPVDETQIQLIVNQIDFVLNLDSSDKLLDIGCGNGALSARLEPNIGAMLGVDLSEYLIGVATEYFSTPKIRFEQISVEEVIGQTRFRQFNKCLLYGVSSFLEDETITHLVDWFCNQQEPSLMLGNVRDRNCYEDFYDSKPNIMDLDNIKTSMGKWRTREWFEQLATKRGLSIKFFKMPSEFYASNYYFDVLITRG